MTSTITVARQNDAPAIAGAAGTLGYTEGDGAQVIDATLAITDVDDTNIESGSVTISAGLVNTEDLLAFTNTANITGIYNATTGVLTLTRTDSLANYETALESVTYTNSNTSNPNTANRTVTWVVNDGDSDSTGINSTITVVLVNDAPTLTAAAVNPTFNEGGAARDLFSGVTVDTIEAGQTIEELTFTVTNVTDGINEIVVIDGDNVALTDTNTGTTGANSYGYSVSLLGSTATVTLTTTGASVADAQTLVDGLAYQNAQVNPTITNRVATLSSIKDNGGIANGGIDTSGLSIASTVTLIPAVPPNNAPTVANPIADQNITAGNLLGFAVSSGVFTDADGDSLTLSATLADNSALPAWLGFDSAAQTFSGTPAGGDVGTLSVKVTAQDPDGAAVSDTFDITVAMRVEVFNGSIMADDDPDEDGLLEISDAFVIDGDESGFVAETLNGSYGDLSVDASGAWSYVADGTQAVLLESYTGESVADNFSLTTIDGTGVDLALTINGVDDSSIIDGDFSGIVAEDTLLVTNGELSITDVDLIDNPVSFEDSTSVPGDNGFGSFEIVDGNWTYTLDSELPEVQSLAVGESLTDTHSFSASDGSSQIVSITIDGTDDEAVPGGVITGLVAEDVTPTATGELTITDVDFSDNPVSWEPVGATLGDSGFGTFELSNDNWTYTLDNAHPDVQGLASGDSLTDTHSFTATDGSTQQVTVTITGSDEEVTTDPSEPDPEVAAQVAAQAEASGVTQEVAQGELAAQAEATIGGSFEASPEPEPEPATAEAQEETLVDQQEAEEVREVQEVQVVEQTEEEEEEAEEEETTTEAEELATVDLSDILNVYKQTIAAPATENAQSGDDAADEALRGENLIKVQEKQLERFIDLANLNLNQVEVRNAQLIELRGVVRSDSFSESLDRLGDSLDEALGQQNLASQLGVASAAGIAAGVSTGILSQVLRAGSLLASFMSVVPLWRHFDPLPVLSAAIVDDKNQAELVGDKDEDDLDDKVEEIFDKSNQEEA